MYYWKKINIILPIVLGIFLVPAIFQLFKPGLIQTDDLTWMVIRFGAFFNTLKDGQIPARLLEGLNNGYSYPVANFLYPGFLYAASVIHVLGVGFVDSVKTLLIVSFIGSGFFTYFWLKKLFDPFASLIGSLFYIYTPYHLYDVYTRGSIGEALAIMWLPFVLWQLERKSVHFVSLGIFFMILSHNSLALILLPVVTLYSAFQKRFLLFLISTILGMLMSSFFIIPAIFELSYTNFSKTVISNPLDYFASIPLQGYSTLFVLAFALAVMFFTRKSLQFAPHKRLVIFFMCITLISLFLSWEGSASIWVVLPSQFIQFPYRVLALLLVGVAFISGFSISRLSGLKRQLLMIILLAILGVSANQFLTVKGWDNFPDDYYLTNMDTTTVKNEYLPKWVNIRPEKKPDRDIEVIFGGAKVNTVEINSKNIVFDLENSKDSTIRVNRIYYPGWIAYMNHEKIPIKYDNDYGVMDIEIARNAGRITMIFQETNLRFFSNVLTLVSVVFVFFLMVRPALKFKQ